MRVAKDPRERKAELVAAAKELFEERGIEKTKVCDIVRRVGVAQGLFYYYFKSKDEIIAAVVGEVVSEIERKSDALIDDPHKNFFQKLTEYIDLYLDNVKRFAGKSNRGMRSLCHSMDQNREIGEQIEALIIGNARRIVEVGIREGILAICYPREMVCMIVYGLRELSMYMYLEREKLLSMVEQAMSLPAGSLSGTAAA